MKNVIKLGFLALSFGLFAVACGGGEKPATDSTATNAGAVIDSAAAKVDSAAANTAAVVDSAAAKVDSVAAKVDSAAAKAVKH